MHAMHSLVKFLQILILLHCGIIFTRQNEVNLATRSLSDNQSANSSDTTIINSPGSSYVSKPNVFSLFVWVVQGSSLDKVELSCGGKGELSKVPINTNNTNFTLPRVNLTLKLQNEDSVTCTVKDGEVVLDTRDINRERG